MAPSRKSSTPSAQTLPIFKAKPVPQMPEGYYSGDKPNPNLHRFVEEHATPYDPTTDTYDVPPFDHAIETTKATAIYNMHTYWSKKPHDAIREYIRHYTRPGGLVLDPFCGSGGTALAALMEGRAAIAIDLSPAATFITKNYCTPVDVNALQAAFEELERKVKPEIDWLYATRCDRCGGPATTAYTVYSQVFQCLHCLEKVALFDCPEVPGHKASGEDKTIRVCPHCQARGIVEEISTRSEKFGAVPVLVSYLCQNGCKPERSERRHNDANSTKREYFQYYDLAKIEEIERKEIPHWTPKIPMIKGYETTVKRNLEAQGIHLVDDLFTKRNLWALAVIRETALKASIQHRDSLLFCFSASLLGVSKMIRESNTATMAGTYYLPQISKEVNAWSSFTNKLGIAVQGWSSLDCDIRDTSVSISTQSATQLDQIASNTLDFIFTDPPYSGTVQYGELNFIWETWLGFNTHWLDGEIIVNRTRGLTENDWADRMRLAMTECYRVLKPGRTITLCYHDSSEGTWQLLQDIMAEVGFVPERSSSALYIDTGQKSYNQLTADKVTKRDLVIGFRKPKLGEAVALLIIDGTEDERTFSEKARAIVSDYLETHPGSTKDRIYDEVVSRMVRQGEMEAHNFVELLAQIAEPVHESVMKTLFDTEQPNLFGTHEQVRWYLKEQAFTHSDMAEQARENAAAQIMAKFLYEEKAKDKTIEGVHYNDLFEKYLYAVSDKPRRALADWLPDYFYKTLAGTWRPPVGEHEEQVKAEGRSSGLTRKIKHFVTALQVGGALPSTPSASDLAGWLRHCKRAGMYAEGKLLYERGGLNLDTLSDEQTAGVEEDYQVCVRELARGKGEPEARRRGKKQA